MPRLPNLLGTRRGRLFAFFLLYVTEGLPLGFTATAVATQMRRQGVEPSEVGVFIGMLYLPWAWKWLVGPVVDLIYSERYGRRRLWIVCAQSLMAFGLLAGMGIDFVSQIGLFTGLVLLINTFGAIQDVAIDALAVGVLEEDERGFANGLMFGGAYAGQALGGSGVLYLSGWIGFDSSFVFVAALVLIVTVFVVLPMREAASPPDQSVAGPRGKAILGELKTYGLDALRAFFGTRAAFLAAVFALLPCGAYSLSLVLQTTLAVELGLTDTDIGTLALLSTIVSGLCCVIGGYLSDRLGRRKMLALYIVCTAIPTLALGVIMQREGWIMPIDPTMTDRPEVPAILVTSFWTACIAYSVFSGLLYGTRTALFMDVCTPAVAATQFTAYMSLINLAIWYTSTWQGFAISNLGYPTTLAIDAAAGVLCLAALPWIRKVKSVRAA